MAIKVTISTLTAVREDLPDYLTTDEFTLQNLQSIADPVPDYLFDIEYWPEDDDTPAFDPRVHVKGAETLTPDDGTKRVSAVCVLDDIPLVDVTATCDKEIASKLEETLTKELDIGGGFMSNLEELRKNRDLFDNSGSTEVYLKSGHRVLDDTQKTTARNKMRGHRKASHKRALEGREGLHLRLDLL